MSDHAITPTRIMAQSAGQKANQAYAKASEAIEKIAALAEIREEPDFDLIFDEFDRRLKVLESHDTVLFIRFEARLRALENPAVPEKRKPGRPRKQEATL